MRRLGKLALVVGGMLLFTLILALLGAFVPPSIIWWLQPLASLTLYLAVAALGALIVFLAAFRDVRRPLGYMAVAVVLLGALRFGGDLIESQLSRSRTSMHSGQKVLDVTSFNARNERSVWLFAWQRQAARRLAGTPQDKPFIRAAYWKKPDVACLQEATEEVQVIWPEITYDQEGRLAVLPLFRYSPYEQLASLEAFEYAISSSQMGNDDFFVRGVYQWRGHQIAVYSVQLRSFARKPWQLLSSYTPLLASWTTLWSSLRYDYLRREQEAKDLRRHLEQERLPFIVCGDFNSTPHNWTYRHIAEGLQAATSRLGAGRSGTYPAGFPLVAVDHILASPHWLPLSTHSFDSRLSDHRVVEGRFALRNGE